MIKKFQLDKEQKTEGGVQTKFSSLGYNMIGSDAKINRKILGSSRENSLNQFLHTRLQQRASQLQQI